ncbi:hypothetical protein M378DRAFT_864965 [Amanita muscaria Koide BX008]|uniref:Uncharacterized protein n=1 Tax=Amanita muscaria (strain Koide BX008) TaxID=946122 RepID=A0A0C2T403_AMAMK|nr:hypothetical protein M378DRAFT_864965 [Amanita muscaria Koide BX008]
MVEAAIVLLGWGQQMTSSSPTADKCAQFFEGLINVCRSPNKYAEGVGRKKRLLEELSVAPNAFGTEIAYAVELALQEKNDQRTSALLKYRLGPILTELKRKYNSTINERRWVPFSLSSFNDVGLIRFAARVQLFYAPPPGRHPVVGCKRESSTPC